MKLKEIYDKYKQVIWTVVVLFGLVFVYNNFIVYGGMMGSSLLMNSKVAMYDMQEAYMYDDYAAGSGVAMREMIAPYPGDGGYDDYYPEEDRKIRKSANVQLEAERDDYETAKLSLEGLVSKNKGYYTSKNENKYQYGDKEYKTFTMTFKVPFDMFESAVSDLRNVAEVKSLNINADDMTTQYNDIKVYLDNYKLEREKLQKLYNNAEEIEDLIMIQERLTQVQRMIDSYESQLKNIERVTDYSTVYVNLQEERDVVDNFYEMTSLREHWRNIVRSFDSFFNFVSNVLGWAIIIGLGYFGYKKAKSKFCKKAKK